MRTKQGALLIIILLTLCVVTGCQQEVKIGAVISLTGEASDYGKRVNEGLQLALEEINGAGGIKGNELQLLVRDSQTTPSVGEAEITSLLGEEKVLAVIGGVSSSVTRAMAPIAEQSKRVLLSPASSSPLISDLGHYIYRNFPSDVLEGARMAAFAYDNLGIKRNMVVMAMQNDYGRGLKKVFVDNYTDMGGKILKMYVYPENQLDFSEMVAEIKAFQAPTANAVYIAGYYNDLAEILLELERQQVDVIKLSVGAFNSAALMQKAGTAAEGVIFPKLEFDPDATDEPIHSFSQAYQAKFGKKPDIYAAHAYDALKILAHAIEKEGPYPEKIQLTLLNLRDYPGVSGLTSFDEKGDVRKFIKMFVVHQGQDVPYETYAAMQEDENAE
jgi:branched-chain amino acid transport system substrate-binding protein